MNFLILDTKMDQRLFLLDTHTMIKIKAYLKTNPLRMNRFIWQ
jgi:hypothetical protein